MANIIVTGAFGVLGRAVTAELISQGRHVIAVDVVQSPPGQGNVLAVGGVDLTNEAAVSEAYAKAAEEVGTIDGLVNVAGGFLWEPIESGQLNSWDRMYELNVRTAFISCRAAIPFLLTSRGAIVNIGAASAIKPGLGMAPYAAAKSGVHALTESLAEELRDRGVRVNAVLPTILDTPANHQDMPKADTTNWVRPQSAAQVIAFLLSARSGSITGASIPLSLAG